MSDCLFKPVSKRNTLRFASVMNGRYSAFTLLEILLVLTITILMLAISVYGIVAMRNQILLAESAARVSSDLRYVRNSSVLLKKQADDNWLYGLGIDFGGVSEVGNPASNSYVLFKWCSPYASYGEGLTDGEIPNYKQGVGGDGRIPTTYDTNCDHNTLVQLDGQYSEFDLDVIKTKVEGRTQGETPTTEKIRFILFESLTGRAFFYGEDGRLLNFTIAPSGDLEMVPFSQEKDAFIELESPRSGSKTVIKVSHISGEINTFKL